ncbi:universal stress protein [Chelatococcus sp. SYSU_G07232]|uniref:Universal stress protein n=1 Tax=Chelatococcus albus TaxID=3047466 RepID=A0ABT7AD29_9HYPH|nr:universal stress protein [Chelatococcus sp. SYSU_G07232]MDJ1156907.1 universal stress protein [Chelatococcus sp. SYSU_G07232]
MYKHILVPTDGTELSDKAIAHGVSLAKAVGATITGLTVSPPFHAFAVDPMMVADTPEAYRDHVWRAATKRLAKVRSAAEAAGVTCDTLHVENDHPYEAIIDTAKTRACDLIVMASHGRRGLSAILLGSETVKVLTHSDIPVLVCR